MQWKVAKNEINRVSYLIRAGEILSHGLSYSDSQHRMAYEKSSFSLNNNFEGMATNSNCIKASKSPHA